MLEFYPVRSVGLEMPWSPLEPLLLSIPLLPLEKVAVAIEIKITMVSSSIFYSHYCWGAVQHGAVSMQEDILIADMLIYDQSLVLKNFLLPVGIVCVIVGQCV